jgi:hypothetical protein
MFGHHPPTKPDFSSYLITFLTFFPKICDIQEKLTLPQILLHQSKVERGSALTIPSGETELFAELSNKDVSYVKIVRFA